MIERGYLEPEYKGFRGTAEFSKADNLYFGKVIGIKGLVSYEGETEDALAENFRGAVDDYLEMCRENGVEPQKA